MESNKQPDKLSDDELIEYLENTEETTSFKFVSKNPVLKFIEQFNLKSGNTPFPSRILHKIYGSVEKEPMVIEDFRREIRKLFYIDKSNSVHINVEESKLTDKILALFEKKKTTKAVNRIRTEINVNFLQLNNLERGDNYIQDYALYFVYKKNKDYFNKDNFIKILKGFLPYKIDKHDIYWFGINKKLEQIISKDDIDELMKARKLDNEKKDKEK
jgi:hypothetical protein